MKSKFISVLANILLQRLKTLAIPGNSIAPNSPSKSKRRN